MNRGRITRNQVALVGLVVAAALLLLLWRMLPVSMAKPPENPPTRKVLSGIAAKLSPPSGYKVGEFAGGLGNARDMALVPNGDIIVSSPPDRVLLVQGDHDGDGHADGVKVLIDHLNNPTGIFLDGDKLYVAEESRVLRFTFDAAKGEVTGAPEVILSGLPVGDMHWTRTIKKGPDGYFYLTLGSNCNVCIETNPYQAVMLRFRPNEKPETFATGLRNTVGFDWQADTGSLYCADNGRDWLGDEAPPDEINRIEAGKFYGWPFFNGDNVPDPDFGKQAGDRATAAVPPAHLLPAHRAPLSLLFLRHQPSSTRAASLQGDALIAEHGSWNRATKAGYQVVALTPECLKEGKSCKTETPFLTGFLQDGKVLGRPVDLAEAPDGTVFVTDDYNGAIWRVSPPR